MNWHGINGSPLQLISVALLPIEPLPACSAFAYAVAIALVFFAVYAFAFVSIVASMRYARWLDAKYAPKVQCESCGRPMACTGRRRSQCGADTAAVVTA